MTYQSFPTWANARSNLSTFSSCRKAFDPGPQHSAHVSQWRWQAFEEARAKAEAKQRRKDNDK